jgi:hypothetical protein
MIKPPPRSRRRLDLENLRRLWGPLGPGVSGDNAPHQDAFRSEPLVCRSPV